MKEPRSAMIASRATEAELHALKVAAEIKGMTVSEFVREVVLPVASETIVAEYLANTI